MIALTMQELSPNILVELSFTEAIEVDYYNIIEYLDLRYVDVRAYSRALSLHQ
jgi:hypothetical protein